MPHYRFFVDVPLSLDTSLSIEGDEHHHMMKVMRCEEGDLIEVVNGKGFLAKALIQHLSKHHAECSIQEVLFKEKSNQRFIIAQSILKASSLELVAEKNTELGAEALWIFPAMRSEKPTLSPNQLERLHKHTLAAMKQCGRLYLPELLYFKDLVEILQKPSCDFLYGDVASSAPSLKACCLKKTTTTVFFVGPESGFHEKEILMLQKRGAKGVSLHANILRAETASIAASALLSASI
jgi:16S rRNA (uracil1498-N3)-methyltransferase